MIVLAMMTVCVPSSASAESGTQTIPSMQFYVVGYKLSADGQISYDVEVTSGGNVDVFLLDEANYNQFIIAQSYVTIADGTVMNTNDVSKQVSLKPGTYYVVIDNTNDGQAFSGDSVTVHYDISASALNWTNIILMLAAAIVVIAVVVFLVLRRRKRKKTAPQDVAAAWMTPPLEPKSE